MKKLNVIYAGWGERYTLGVLADNGRDILFEYTPEALKRGLEVSPFKLPLSSQTYGNHPDHQMRLPGFISDSLPDGWGILVMDRLFRRQGLEPSQVSPLHRLAFIGESEQQLDTCLMDSNTKCVDFLEKPSGSTHF